VGPFPTMYVLIFDQSVLLTECLITYTTWVWPLPTMYMFMFDPIDLMAERLITYRIVWPLLTMYALMSDQITLPPQFLITYIAGKTNLSTVYLELFIHWYFEKSSYDARSEKHQINIVVLQDTTGYQVYVCPQERYSRQLERCWHTTIVLYSCWRWNLFILRY